MRFSKSRGEGLLARSYISDISRYSSKKIYINGINYSYLKKKNIHIKTNFFTNYIYPFWGVLNLWKEYLLKRKIIYLNYLPLWNFLLFLFLPKNTILGPITGGSYYSKSRSLNYYIRKYFFPTLYRISLKIIQKKFDKVIFSTDLLKLYIKEKEKFVFNYCLNIYERKIIKKIKKYDVIFYHRINKNKNNFDQIKLIKKLINYNFKVIIIGDNPKLDNSLYLGNLSSIKALNYISMSKYAVNNNENLHSLFCLDALSCGTKVIHFGKKNIQEVFFSKDSIFHKEISNVDKQFLIIRKLLKARNNKKIKVNKNYFKNKKINKYFSNLNL